MTSLLDIAIITIFARETLEGGIIIGEYRTVILRSPWEKQDFTKQHALRTITLTACFAAAVAVVICAAVAVPLAILSREFDNTTAIIIEGVSKIVAAICILQLSLKMPKFFGLYKSKAAVRRGQRAMHRIEQLEHAENASDGDIDIEAGYDSQCNDVNDDSAGLTLQSIRFNVAWNIWREVAECGVFLIPFFLTGDGIIAIPLSAVVGVVIGTIVCVGIYIANHRLKSKVTLTVFTVLLLVSLAAGLFSGGVHKFEMVYGFTPVVYRLRGSFWSVSHLPMTVLKPFGYSDVRTVLQMGCYWGFLFVSGLLHRRKYSQCHVVWDDDDTQQRKDGAIDSDESRLMEENSERCAIGEGNEKVVVEEEGSDVCATSKDASANVPANHWQPVAPVSKVDQGECALDTDKILRDRNLGTGGYGLATEKTRSTTEESNGNESQEFVGNPRES